MLKHSLVTSLALTLAVAGGAFVSNTQASASRLQKPVQVEQSTVSKRTYPVAGQRYRSRKTASVPKTFRQRMARTRYTYYDRKSVTHQQRPVRRNSFQQMLRSERARTVRQQKNELARMQARNRKASRSYRKPVQQSNVRDTDWYRDGLTNRELRARYWVSGHESGHRWRAISYGHVCVGYFQLTPGYLGYKHGHVNLNHKHQVKVADRYAKHRYGGWVHAKHFWKAHHWY